LVGRRLLRTLFVRHDQVRERLQPREIHRSIQGAKRRGRIDVQAKAQCARPVIRGVQKIVELPESRFPGMLFDDSRTPVIRTRIPDRSEHPAAPSPLEDSRFELQFDRVDRHRIGSGEVASTVDEAADADPLSGARELEAARGNR
jgi:hypothetical protein